jgi:hypothetical protein
MQAHLAWLRVDGLRIHTPYVIRGNGQPDGHRPDLLQLIIGILCQSCFNFQIFFFAYVNVFTSYGNAGLFDGPALPDLAHLQEADYDAQLRDRSGNLYAFTPVPYGGAVAQLCSVFFEAFRKLLKIEWWRRGELNPRPRKPAMKRTTCVSGS